VAQLSYLLFLNLRLQYTSKATTTRTPAIHSRPTPIAIPIVAMPIFFSTTNSIAFIKLDHGPLKLTYVYDS